LLSETDPEEAVRLHQQLTEITAELNACEEKWMELSGDV
jgi:ATP-binding cassette subfamily F protein 3